MTTTNNHHEGVMDERQRAALHGYLEDVSDTLRRRMQEMLDRGTSDPSFALLTHFRDLGSEALMVDCRLRGRRREAWTAQGPDEWRAEVNAAFLAGDLLALGVLSAVGWFHGYLLDVPAPAAVEEGVAT